LSSHVSCGIVLLDVLFQCSFAEPGLTLLLLLLTASNCCGVGGVVGIVDDVFVFVTVTVIPYCRQLSENSPAGPCSYGEGLQLLPCHWQQQQQQR
jgi:hypothetical protein